MDINNTIMAFHGMILPFVALERYELYILRITQDSKHRLFRYCTLYNLCFMEFQAKRNIRTRTPFTVYSNTTKTDTNIHSQFQSIEDS